MHRMRVGLVAAIVLLAASLGIYALVMGDLKTATVRSVETDVSRAQRMHQSLARLESLDFANLVTALSRKPGLVAVFEKDDEGSRRQAAFEQCELINASLQSKGKRADIVAMLDSTGKVVARDLNVNALYGEDLRAKFPAVGAALRGEATKDIWTLSSRMTLVAVAPIIQPDGTTKGALLVGYVMTARDAQLKRDLLGTEVAYFHNGKVQTSSFVVPGTSDKEDGNKTQALNNILFDSQQLGPKALQGGAGTDVLRVELDGEEYAFIASPLHGNAFDKTSGVALLKSMSAEVSRFSGVGVQIFAFGLLAILIAVGATVLTSIRFIKPLDRIELGVAEIINGNIDYQFKDVGADFEGLANGLNVMLARLLGRDEPSEDSVEEEGDDAQRWRSDQMQVEDLPAASASSGSDPAVAALAQENDVAYYSGLFGEYVAAMKAKGKPTTGITIQAFTAKLRLVEGGLKQKWKCRMVRFRVSTQGDQVTLKPVPIP